MSENRLPAQRRPGMFVNKGKDEESKDRDSSSPPTPLSIARGRMMETVMAYIKQAPCRRMPNDRMPFLYPPKPNSPTNMCMCYRAKKNILCQACGYMFQGRVRARCPVHPTVIHLMDTEACPNCRATHLKEFSVVSKRAV